jgi:cyclohexadieny/prephenate dehydrogenase
MAPFRRVAIIGLGLIGSSIARAARQAFPDIALTGTDRDPAVRERVRDLRLLDDVADGPGAAVIDADLVILAVPLGAYAGVTREIGPELGHDAIVSDVGSAKAAAAALLRDSLGSSAVIVPAHPVAGTERSGPDAGMADLFQGRWCILTPDAGTAPGQVERVAAFWRALGSHVELMSADHHDLVLAVTSHVPHLIAYAIVGTAADIESVTRGEVIKYSAGGFRDFTRIAASDPVMWRDIFLHNRDAVLEILGRIGEDLSALQRAIRWGDGETLHARFESSQAIRRAIVDAGQDTNAADFGRTRAPPNDEP